LKELKMDTIYFHFHEVWPGTADFDDYQEARYDVFCDELGRVEPTGQFNRRGHPIETDRFDAFSRHFIARHKTSDVVAGFMRVIMPNPIGLNVSDRYVIDQPMPYGVSMDQVGEISRLAVTPVFRRRQSDEGKPVQGDPETEMTGRAEGMRRHQPELVLGLYRDVYHLCQSEGVDYCVAAMDRRFSRLLNTLGFPFLAVGPVNEAVFPARRVYLISAQEMESSLGSRENCILRFMQAQLERLQPAALALAA
jgi:N-acyl amino acid synthase of PEP-CTERM/exosortase system